MLDFSFLGKYYMFFLIGAKNTIIIAAFSVLFGVVLGTLLALMKQSKIWVLRTISSAYIEFVRGTPLLVQLFIVYYGLPMNLSAIPAGIVALSFNSGAYVAEIIRAGIGAVDKGQMEAARSLGMTHIESMRYIILPQALRNILPVLGNEFITVIKESSIVSVIGIPEIMYNAETVRGNTFKPFEPLLAAAIIYFILTYSLSKLVGRTERRLKTSD